MQYIAISKHPAIAENKIIQQALLLLNLYTSYSITWDMKLQKNKQNIQEAAHCGDCSLG